MTKDPQSPRGPSRRARRRQHEPADAAEVRRSQLQDDESSDVERASGVRPRDPSPDRVVFDENESGK